VIVRQGIIPGKEIKRAVEEYRKVKEPCGLL
jgi:hypothetical protein